MKANEKSEKLFPIVKMIGGKKEVYPSTLNVLLRLELLQDN